MNCHCQSGLAFQDCCGPFLEGTDFPATAEALMRSRYCAHVEHRADYLLQTWAVEYRPKPFGFDPDQRWLGLTIKQTEAGQVSDDSGVVEFVARYKVHGKGYRLHEISRFERRAGRWVYVCCELQGQ